ncbi:MAG TPA: hypothetical protein VND19_17265 [Acetobacteraceae bacterium]|nr:hypothetical protein [Acetobacteraceae bacterium]
MSEHFSQGSPDLLVLPCQKKSPPRLHWIEIILVDEADQPVPWEEYEITLPDGSIVHGALDRQGFARVDSIADAGMCRITFPRLDTEVWSPAGGGG